MVKKVVSGEDSGSDLDKCNSNPVRDSNEKYFQEILSHVKRKVRVIAVYIICIMTSGN
jgi:hypothetical protein